MLFVPHVNTYVKYLETRMLFSKKDIDRLRQNIIESNSNIIVLNSKFIDHVEEIIDESHELRDESNQFLKHLIDSNEDNSLMVTSNNLSLNPDANFKELCEVINEDDIIIGVSESTGVENASQNILYLENVKKVNRNYIFSKLLTNEICQIRYTDVEQSVDIVDLLNTVYGLYKNIITVIIIDRNANLNHRIYDKIIEMSPLFKYYKLYADNKDAFAVKNKLKKYELYTTNNIDLIHERVIIIRNIIITIDEDPYNIEHRNTWQITIEFSKDTSEKIISDKCSLFSKTLFSTH